MLVCPLSFLSVHYHSFSLPFLLLLSALEACPPELNNCNCATWTPPAAVSKSVNITTLREAIQAYPQQGQHGIDCNGWVVIMVDLDGPSGIFFMLRSLSVIMVQGSVMNLGGPHLHYIYLS